ncbi:alkaline protease 2 [Ceratobasidium sp. AG-Ba]|nr:alkaline protease 2 [Ceratobasidium sp. AG-Ba]
MRSLSLYVIAVVTAFSVFGNFVFAAPTTSGGGTSGSKRYIVMLNTNTNMTSHKVWLNGEWAKMKSNTSTMRITSEYDVLNGYTAELTDDVVAKLANSSSVATLAPDVPCSGQLIQTNAPWGISRISRTTKLPLGSSVNNVNYIFRRKPSSLGIDVYVLDTGVNTAHLDFGNRATWGATFGGYQNQDGHGHGTHVAGTIAGRRYGVAKAASIIAVKVLNDQNRGLMSDVIAGVNWATGRALASGRPSVINISIASDDPHPPTDWAVTNAVNLGMHVVVAAGNGNTLCTVTSPARAPAVLTVGATTINDRRWVWSATSGSNFGPGVDIFAPGEYITSTWIGSNTATRRMTGTSMAAPHVSGLVAYLLAIEGRRTPAAMRARIKVLGPNGLLTGIPPNTINEIIWNGGD